MKLAFGHTPRNIHVQQDWEMSPIQRESQKELQLQLQDPDQLEKSEDQGRVTESDGELSQERKLEER